MSAAGAAQGVGGLLEASGHAAEGEARAAAAEYNAKSAEQNAKLSVAQAREEERRLRVMSRKQLGDMRANYAASGVQMEGSPLDVLEESAATAELDALTVRHGGQVKAAQARSEASLQRFQGEYAKAAGYLKATTTLIDTGSKMGAGSAKGAK
jgi:hypothetical protein